jgi:hypothetical protein
MAKQMQNVKFKSLDDFFEHLPNDELKIVEILRKQVFECIPDVQEKLSFQVPFYYGRKSICFIWPGSVWWGSKQTIFGVQFGFTRGHRLTNIDNHFEIGSRKQLITKTYTSPREIDLPLLSAFLYEAALLDQ